MTFSRNAFVFFLIAFTEVATWTIDLPEVRKFLFEKYADSKKVENDKIEIEADDGRKFYSNMVSNSLYHAEPPKDRDDKTYDNDYIHVSYMEKKVSGIVRSGDAYLEGLRRAIERYTQYLESCKNRNGSMIPNLDFPLSMPNVSLPNVSLPINFTMSNPPSFNFTLPSPPSLPDLVTPMSSFNFSNISINCEEVNKRSENVRRLAQLAMWSTMRLQDLAYAKKYQKIDEYEENELILKLAWFLDRLAYLTGYEPEPKEFLPSTTARPITVSPTPMTAVSVADSVKTAMMDCLNENSSTPATERCRFPLPIPDIIRQITNTSVTNALETSTEAMDVIPVPSTDSIPQQSMELLITSDDNPFRNYPPLKPRNKRHIDKNPSNNLVNNPFRHFSFVKYFKTQSTNSKPIVKLNNESNKKSVLKDIFSVKLPKPINRVFDKPIIVIDNEMPIAKKKNSVPKKFSPVYHKKTIFFNKSSRSLVKSISKRSADSPMSKLMNYYFKYKVWESSNPLTHRNDKENDQTLSQAHKNEYVSSYDVENRLTLPTRAKRSLLLKKDGHLHVLTPLKNLRSFIKNNKQRIHYNTYVLQRPKIISHLETIRHQINLGKVDVKKKDIRKRSLRYENLYLPRQSANPFQDISYYVKNREGTEYNPSLTQAAQVRLGLEQIFQTGNIEVVRRYGSNYNPLDPAPFYTGLLRSMADS